MGRYGGKLRIKQEKGLAGGMNLSTIQQGASYARAALTLSAV
jgi:hypothetical protein